MPRTMHNLSTNNNGAENSTVLAIFPCLDDFTSLQNMLDEDRWIVRNASSCGEAIRLVAEEQPAVVTCEHELPDGTWRDLFKLFEALQNPPPIVVVSRNADETLWAEVLNLGGYDVLAKPFDRNEVERVIEMARRHGNLMQTARI